MKILKWLSLAIVGMVILLPVSVNADDSDNAQVVAVPYVGGGLVSFTATYISDTQVDLAWVKGAETVYVMVRAKYGAMPIDRTDGYLVYEGALDAYTDTSMDFDETTSILYYRIWGRTAAGVWADSLITTNEVEGISVVLIFLAVLAIGISYLALRSNFPALKMGAGFTWIAVMMYIKDNPPGTLIEGSATHQALMLVSILVGAGMLLTAVGGNINRQRNYEGGNASFGDWKWKFGNDKSAYTGSQPTNGRETPEQYQLRVRKALRRDDKK